MFIARFQAADRNDVDPATEDLLEFIGEMHQIEQGTTFFELDQEIDVAVRSVVAAGDA